MDNLKKLEQKKAIETILKAGKPQRPSFDYRIDPVAHEIVVHAGSNYAVLLCISYFLDHAKKHRGFEFYQRLTNLPGRPLPSGRQATFTEELLSTGFAAEVSDDASIPTETIIKNKVAVVYGHNATVTVQAVPLRTSP